MDDKGGNLDAVLKEAVDLVSPPTASSVPGLVDLVGWNFVASNGVAVSPPSVELNRLESVRRGPPFRCRPAVMLVAAVFFVRLCFFLPPLIRTAPSFFLPNLHQFCSSPSSWRSSFPLRGLSLRRRRNLVLLSPLT
jgi:hypothetical protein